MRTLQDFLGLDLRALATLRIAYGFLILLDLALRSRSLRDHYTDLGAVPRDELLRLDWKADFWSLHMISGTLYFQALLFLLAAGAAFCLLMGYRTRLAAFLSWLMLCSLHTRNPMLLDGGDAYLRCMMFWCMWLPWGARWSIDSFRRRSRCDLEKPWFDASTLAYLFQFSLIYWVTAALKNHPSWTTDFTAVYYALSIDMYTTPLAGSLLAHPGLMQVLTVATLSFEALGPILLWAHPSTRAFGALGFMLLHLGFGSFLNLGIFALIGMASPLGMLPRQFFNRLEATQLFKAIYRYALRLASHWPLPGRGTSTGRLPLAVSAVLLALLVYVAYWDLCVVSGSRMERVSPRLGNLLRLDQSWRMFAPAPLTADGWFVVEGEQINGQTLDLLHTTLSWEKPNRPGERFESLRWRGYLSRLPYPQYARWRPVYTDYLERKWNRTHQGDQRLKTIKLYFMQETTLPDGVTPIEKKLLHEHVCKGFEPKTPIE